MPDFFKEILLQSRQCLDALIDNEQSLKSIQKAAELMTSSLKSGGMIVSCGNGGSHCDAMHFAEELMGRFRENRKPLKAIAVSDPAYISCTANDFGYDQVFARYMQGMVGHGDVMLGISTSGRSQNIINAAMAAREAGAMVVGLAGKTDSPLKAHCDVYVACEGVKYADRVQELHIKVIHGWIEYIESHLT